MLPRLLTRVIRSGRLKGQTATDMPSSLKAADARMNPFSYHHSDELKDKVRALHQRGETYRSIEKKLGLTRNSVAGLCSRLGLSSGAQVNPVLAAKREVRDQNIRRLLLAGATISEITEELHVSRNIVHERRRHFGIAPTHHGDRRRVRSAPPVRVVEKAPEPEPVVAPDPATAVPFTSAQGCRYALWSGDEMDLDRKRVCGGEIAKGSYCGFHGALVYVPFALRKAA